MTVNPTTGKKERIFVDLRAVYPTPELPGTELSFEEIWAASSGLLHASWEADTQAAEDVAVVSVASPVDVLADNVATKLVVHHDVVMLDENGAMIKKQDRENRPKKKKMTEINETQISKWSIEALVESCAANASKQSRPSWTRRPSRG